jgi:hypothetical protein
VLVRPILKVEGLEILGALKCCELKELDGLEILTELESECGVLSISIVERTGVFVFRIVASAISIIIKN